MKCLAVVLAGSLASALAARVADDSLTAAKDLYASAAYDEALSMLTKLTQSGSESKDAALQIDAYRSFCLYALGRTAEAESAARAVIERDPLFQLSADEISPRVESMFAEVRRRLLPGLIREKYRLARAALDRKDFAVAEPLFSDVRRMIDRGQQIGLRDEALADLGVLADGFLDLAHAATTTATTRAAVSPPTPPERDADAAPVLEGPRSASAASAETPSPSVYEASRTDVTPPVTISQTLPPIPAPMLVMLQKGATRRHGIIEVTIEPDGRVGEAVIRESVNSAYDSMVVSAARQWRYKPATKDGVPVRYIKTIALEVQPD
jgi:TonB family protein